MMGLLTKLRSQQGVTLVELSASLAIAGILIAGVVAAITGFQSGPRRSIGEVAIRDQLRTATGIIREDTAKAATFQPGSAPRYGSFRWLDYSTFPPVRHHVQYYWEEGVLFREAYVDQDSFGPLALVRHVAAPEDVSFAIVSRPNSEVATVEVRMLAVTISASSELDDGLPFQEEATLEVALRPEQTGAIGYRYLFLHNNPAPPTNHTGAQEDLRLSGDAPTAAILYNYDVGRDAQPGLQLLPSDDPGEMDPGRHQDWVSSPLERAMTIEGRLALHLWAAAVDFAPGQTLEITASLAAVDPSTGVETAVGNLPVAWVTTESGWSLVTLWWDSLSQTVPGGHRLKLTVRFGEASETAGMLAYDTEEYVALLMAPAAP